MFTHTAYALLLCIYKKNSKTFCFLFILSCNKLYSETSRGTDDIFSQVVFNFTMTVLEVNIEYYCQLMS